MASKPRLIVRHHGQRGAACGGGCCSHDELASAASLIAGALIEGGVDLLVTALAAGIIGMRTLLTGIAAANSTALPVLAAYEYEVLGLSSGEDLGNASLGTHCGCAFGTWAEDGRLPRSIPAHSASASLASIV